MSITTGKGDDGFTDLLYGRRVAKTDRRIEAGGAVDELNAALGLGRATAGEALTLEILAKVQEELIGLMGEVACHPDDREQYRRDGHPGIGDHHVAELAQASRRLEDEFRIRFRDWARPGARRHLPGAQLDFARTVCRRAERALLALLEAGTTATGASPPDDPVLRRHAVYLNRLSDLLWLLARHEEAAGNQPA